MVEDFRQIMRTRYQFCRQARTKIQHIKALLVRFGFSTDTKGLPQTLIDEILNLKLPANIKKSINYHIETYKFLKEKIKQLEEDASELIASSNQKEEYEIIKSIPGVGHITASFVVGEVGDWQRFKNERQIAAFFGLTPSEYSSGEYVHKGRITGQGNEVLRALIVEASWLLIAKDERMRNTFDRLFVNTKSKKKEPYERVRIRLFMIV
ncbi:MAG: IS110 family transposase [Oligoflexia bacterium]|nr:IS110 family transposase [Oligoflexia bacterium]